MGRLWFFLGHNRRTHEEQGGERNCWQRGPGEGIPHAIRYSSNANPPPNVSPNKKLDQGLMEPWSERGLRSLNKLENDFEPVLHNTRRQNGIDKGSEGRVVVNTRLRHKGVVLVKQVVCL